MKYKITRHAEGSAFVPFSVTITCETQGEARALHDLAVIKLSKSGKFIGDCYRAYCGELANDTKGTIEHKP